MSINNGYKGLKAFVIIFSLFVILFYIFNYYEFGDYYIMKATGDWMVSNHKIMYTNVFFQHNCDIVVQQWVYCIYLSLISNFDKYGLLFSVIFFLILYYLVVNLFLKLYIDDKFVIYGIFFISVLFSFYYMFKVRPETLSIILILLEIIALDRYRNTENVKWLILLPLTMLIEINCHGSFWLYHFIVMLPFIVPCLPCLVKNEVYSLKQLKVLGVFVLITIAVMFCNPYGMDMIMYLPNAILSNTFSYVAISELETLKIFSKNGLVVAIALMLFIFVLVKSRMSSISFYFTIGFVFMTIVSIRNGMFISLVMVFLLKELYINFLVKLPKHEIKEKSEKTLIGIICFGLCVYLSFSFIGINGHIGFDRFLNNTWYDYGVEKNTDVFKELNKVANKDDKVYSFFVDTSYLAYLGYTNLYIDSRPELYMKRINHKTDYLSDYYDVFKDNSEFKAGRSVEEFINENNFKYILCNVSSGYYPKVLIIYLSYGDKYNMLYESNNYYLFERID